MQSDVHRFGWAWVPFTRGRDTLYAARLGAHLAGAHPPDEATDFA